MTCTHCGTPAPAKANYCPACGRGYARSERLCVKCGAINPEGANFCVHCSSDLNAAAARKIADAQPRTAGERKRDKVIACGCWFAALFLALQATRYLSADAGKVMFVAAAAFAIGGFNIWPKTPAVPPASGDGA